MVIFNEIDQQVSAKIIGDELGNREGWSILTKLTTLLYYLINSQFSFLHAKMN